MDGLNVSFVEETLIEELVPEVTSSNIRYLVSFVLVSSLTVILPPDAASANVVIPVINPFAFTVIVVPAPVPPKVPTLELTVANVVALLTDVISPV